MIVFLKGLPASGKSTWAKEQCSILPNTIRVNKDDIRSMLGGQFSHEKEDFVLKIRDVIVLLALREGKTVIVDDTNFHEKHYKRMEEIAKDFDKPIVVKEFDTDVDECIRRDAERINPVGKKVIMDMYRKYVKPIPEPVKFVNGRESAIIVDIDGTLAHMKNRGPYEWSRVGEDEVDDTIKNIVYFYKINGAKIILVSGRSAVCRTETIEWLERNKIEFDNLYMREKDDNRKDWLVKQEIYDHYIKDNFNILFVLDDREQVVNMWRENGLKCLQVAEGNF